MSLFESKFSQMILHTERSKLIYNWSFLVLHKPTLLTSTFKVYLYTQNKYFDMWKRHTSVYSVARTFKKVKEVAKWSI